MTFRQLATLFSISLMLCGCNNHNEKEPVQEVSIAYLKSLCTGDHYRIVDDYTIRGVVVATDWLNESYQSLTIVDRSGGLEVAIGAYGIDNNLPIYSEVTIFCNGLMLARIGHKIELGAVPTGDFPLDCIDETMLYQYIRTIGICKEFTPATKHFSEIGVADMSAIIRFDNVQICEEERGLIWCDLIDDTLVTTIRTIMDREGNSFGVRTLPRSIYAAENIPTKEISVIGIIDYADNRYCIRLVNEGVIQ